MQVYFYQQYQNLSNTELLKIVQRPEYYQPEAAYAANRVLAERDVSNEEVEAVQHYFDAEDERKKTEQARIEKCKSKLNKMLDPFVYQEATVQAGKRLQVFIIAIGAQLLFMFYNSCKHIVQYVHLIRNCETYGYSFESGYNADIWTCASAYLFYIAFDLPNFVYIPTVVYLLYKRRSFGWVLLFAVNLLGLFSVAGDVFIYFQMPQVGKAMPITLLSFFAIRALYVAFLWNENTAALFTVSQKQKQYTALACGLIVASLVVLVLLNN